MEIKIWSDVRCPFCYIGKRKFESALEKFAHKDEVEVIWKSFELDPGLKTQIDRNIYEFFAEIKNISVEKAMEMNKHVAQVAKEIGLDFNLDAMVVANSFNAHRLLQIAKGKNLGNEAKEALFKAQFIEGINIDDIESILQLGISIGLTEEELRQGLDSKTYAAAVKQDEYEASTSGIRGVPFFVFDNKYAVSGAQSPEFFLETIEKAWSESSQ